MRARSGWVNERARVAVAVPRRIWYATGMSKLHVTLPNSTRITHELGEELVTIGRSPDNRIHLDDPSVSGRHAQIHLVGETFHLQDLESTNGTQVNGENITSAVLHVGDRIVFGKVAAAFESDPHSVPQTVPALREQETKPAEFSARPSDFANASPFPRRRSEKDPTRTALFAAAAVAILAFLASMLALAQMRLPAIP